MRFLIIFLMIFNLTSCRYFQKEVMIDKHELTDLVIIGVDKQFDFSDSIPDIVLTGTWKQHSAWIKEESEWKGFKSLNANYEYKFHENGVFHHTRYYNDSIVTDIFKGDYKLLHKSSTLGLIFNDNGDTLFQHGDTAKFSNLHIYSLNDSVLRLEGCFVGHCEEEEFTEFRRL